MRLLRGHKQVNRAIDSPGHGFIERWLDGPIARSSDPTMRRFPTDARRAVPKKVMEEVKKTLTRNIAGLTFGERKEVTSAMAKKAAKKSSKKTTRKATRKKK